MRKYMSLLLIVALLSLTFSSTTLAASVGQQLTAPEPGWQRFDDAHADFVYEGAVRIQPYVNHYNGSIHYLESGTTSVKFSFKGTKLRVYGYAHTVRVPLTEIYIDGIKETYSEQFTPAFYGQNLFYEKVGLEDKVHSVLIESPSATPMSNGSFDAIDIDVVGYITKYSPTEEPSISLVQGGNNVSTRIFIVNYAQARSVKKSLVLPYGYSTGVK